MPVPGYFFAELVREGCHDEGTGALVLAGPLAGHRGFAGVVPVGASFCYAIAGVTTPAQWECGVGRIAADGRIERLSVSASSNGGALVAFAPGLKTVALTVGAGWYAAASLPPAMADVAGLSAALAGKQAAGSYAAASHTHAIAEVGGLQAAIDGKQPLSTGHSSVSTLSGTDQVTVRRGGDWVNVAGSGFVARDGAGHVGIGTTAAARARLDVQTNGVWHQLRLSANQPNAALYAGAVTSGVGSWLFDASFYASSLMWEPVGSDSSGIRMVGGELMLCGNSGLTPGTLFAPSPLLIVGAAGVRPGTDNGLSLGHPALRWAQIYSASGTISTSDARDKKHVGRVPDAWLDAWGDVDWCRYRFRKGRRWHIGLVAQHVVEAFAGRGIDAFAIGLVCRDAVDGLGSREDRWGLRYDECLALEAAWQRRELARLGAVVAGLRGMGDDAPLSAATRIASLSKSRSSPLEGRGDGT